MVGNVHLAGAGMTMFAKQPGRDLKSLVAEAVSCALEDAALPASAVQAAYFGNAVAGTITGQEMVAGQVTLAPMGMLGIPIINAENACASASTAFHLAWQAVAAGACDVALAVGAEKMTHADKARSFAAIGGSVDMDDVPADLPPDRSFLMDLYAATAREYMRTTGATVEDFAAVVVKNQRNGMLNPLAQYGAELTIQEVLDSRMISDPFTLLMCSPITDGAAAAILVSDRARLPRRPRIKVAASVVRSNGGEERVSRMAAAAAYEIAGVGPEDLDCVEVHDAAASAELVLYEQVGLAPPGGGPALIRDGATSLRGRIPVNTSGGLLARGHPIGATGLGQIYEAACQLRGRAEKRQIEGARVAMCQNAGGFGGADNLVGVVHIFVAE